MSAGADVRSQMAREAQEIAFVKRARQFAVRRSDNCSYRRWHAYCAYFDQKLSSFMRATFR